MMKNEVFKALITIIILVFSLPALCFAAELEEFDICGYDALDSDYISIHKDDLVNIRRMPWEPIGDKMSIVVTGSIFPSAGVSRVTYSLNGGATSRRADGEDPFSFNFVPVDGGVYFVVVDFFDREGGVILSKEIEVNYSTINWDEFFTDKIETLRSVYVNKNLSEFLSLFDDSEYPTYRQFEKGMRSTFEDNGLITLTITVKNITIEGDTAIAIIDWRKTFADDSYQSGTDDEISFFEREDAWRVSSLSDEALFVIGNGTVNVTY